MERRLAAILAADVVGYSRLMEQDEAGTLAALTERRKCILAPLVTEHHLSPDFLAYAARFERWARLLNRPSRAYDVFILDGN